ncbi:RecQ family ATP-dependent DNA helicase [Prochlorothrix hollandica]|uniref:RecQ family ATP-dependent DNA helicase n=1 Tax=Prochlorothrix hollandica TaxID=1223 RepID=UPI000348D3F6|nr:RecQ family ATP-dependent DNA helicase [Prochlorothrix hollandica]
MSNPSHPKPQRSQASGSSAGPGEPPPQWHQVQAAFQRIWGYSDFRSPQGEIVQALIQGQDALVVMPTGGGKSICFQLPALLHTGLTLVISPLVALMENQVADLHQKRLPAALLHSQLSKSQRQTTLTSLEQGRLRLLYLSPETLFSPPVWQRLQAPDLRIQGLMLDEAHCLVQWGDTFRPDYRRLGSVRPALLRHKPPGTRLTIAAFTATADPETQASLCQVLQLRRPQKFILNPYRPQLTLGVHYTWSPRQRWERIHHYLSQRSPQSQESGLIYVRTRQDGENLAEKLRNLGHKTLAYHGGLKGAERRRIEGDWMAHRLPFVVSTNAFGMGVDNPRVRWVIHYQVPLLLAEYIQEVGRAGRDGKPAEALAFISEPTGWLDPSDRQRWRFFQEQQQRQHHNALRLANKIPPQGTIQLIQEQFPQGTMALGLLHSLDRLQWQDPFTYRILQTPRSKFTQAHGPKAKNPSQAMAHYLHNRRHCRWGLLLQAFGFQPRKAQCGHCDNCLRSQRPLPRSG